jgi:hypothetical protein
MPVIICITVNILLASNNSLQNKTARAVYLLFVGKFHVNIGYDGNGVLARTIRERFSNYGIHFQVASSTIIGIPCGEHLLKRILAA